MNTVLRSGCSNRPLHNLFQKYRSIRPFVIAWAALLGIAAGALRAQIISQTQSDFSAIRSDALLGTSPSVANASTFGSVISFGTPPQSPGASQPKPFNFNVFSPLNFFSAEKDGGNFGSVSEAKPEVKIGFIIHPQKTPFQLSGFVDEYSDRYTGSPRNSDVLDGSLRVDWVGSEAYPSRDGFIPYISYSPQQSFMPFFDKRAIITQDYALGINKLWDFGPDWSRFNATASGFPTWEIGFQLAGQRRFSDAPPDSYALIVGPSVKWAATNQAEFPHVPLEKLGKLSASVAVNLTRRWYDQANGTAERTWGITPVLTVSWVFPPKWFGSFYKSLGAPELDFQAAYNDQLASVAKNSSQQIAIGPILKSGWNF